MFKFNLQMAGSDSWMSVKEAALYLGKSPHWLYQNRQRLGIPCTFVGGSLRFEKGKLDDWLTVNSQNGRERKKENAVFGKVSLI